jgi:hypothetical protein
MTDDFSAISGGREAYVPCDEVALAVVASGQDSNAVYGEEEGFVALDNAAAAESADETDTSAVFGKRAGYVPGPCIDCTSVITGMDWNDMDIGGSGTSWAGGRGDRTGAGSFTRQTIPGSQTSGTGWITTFEGTPSHAESEGRSYVSIDVSGLAGPAATHVRLNATLRNWVALIHESYVIGNEAPVDWELVAGNWGTGTPTWDDGTAVASGTIPASTASFDADGLVVVPLEETSFTSPMWPITGGYAQWYFRNVSPTGYLYSTGSPANGHPFTPSEIDLRYPNDTFADPFSPINYFQLRSYINLNSLIPSSGFEDWTLDVFHCT